MTDLDDHDLFTETPATVNVTRKRCRRHVWVGVHRCTDPDGLALDMWHFEQPHTGREVASCEPATICAQCFRFKDPAKSRRARNNKNRGLAIQRRRIEGLGGTNLAGNNENLDGIGLAFAYESKSGGAFSERIWRWLTGIPTKGSQTGVLIVTETPGPGRRARSYVVVEYDEWKALHGETRE